MLTETLPFLQALYDGLGEGYITLTAIHPQRKAKQAAPSRHIPLGDTTMLADALDRLTETNLQGWGAYFAVAPRIADLGRWRRGGKRDLLTLPALWVDIDTDPETAINRLNSFEIPPSGTVSSGGGIHSYWFISPTRAFEEADRALRGLAQTLGGDKTNVAQSLRLPGSINIKPARNSALCHIIDFHLERRYHLADFKSYQANQPLEQYRSSNLPMPVFNSELNPSLVNAISRCLLSEYDGYVKSNGYIAALCPCGHCHDLPGSHFNFDMTRALGRCFGRHGRLLLKDLCVLLRIDPAFYGGLYTAT
jgi:hypothetical protein